MPAAPAIRSRPGRRPATRTPGKANAAGYREETSDGLVITLWTLEPVTQKEKADETYRRRPPGGRPGLPLRLPRRVHRLRPGRRGGGPRGRPGPGPAGAGAGRGRLREAGL